MTGSFTRGHMSNFCDVLVRRLVGTSFRVESRIFNFDTLCVVWAFVLVNTRTVRCRSHEHHDYFSVCSLDESGLAQLRRGWRYVVSYADLLLATL
jgi:hypothetical protein